MTLPSHALFLGSEFLGEVLPDGLNHYSPERLVPLPSTYWTPGYRWRWEGRTPVEDIAAVEAEQIALVKVEAERRKMLSLTPGGAKKAEYAEKGTEVRTFWTLGGTVSAVMAVLGTWPSTRRAAVFPWATASAAEFGDSLAAAIARFEGGIARSLPVHDVGAVEEHTCALIRAATTATAKRAAAARWPVNPA